LTLEVWCRWGYARLIGIAWNVVSILGSGAYREVLTVACQDLMSANCPLFIPSANRVNAIGLNRLRTELRETISFVMSVAR
jgi:hypothetical protein